LIPAALLERWLEVCRVKITFKVLPTKSFVSTKKKFDEMRCKLDSTENLRSFEKYPMRVPGLGQITSQIVLTKKISGHEGENFGQIGRKIKT